MKIYLSDCSDLLENDLPRFLFALPPGRRAYAARFKRTVDRAAAAVGFLLVSRLIREVDPALSLSDWVIGEHGKPSVPGAPFHFSLSHSDGLCGSVRSAPPCSRGSVRPTRSPYAKGTRNLPSRSGRRARQRRRKTVAGSDRS